MRRLMKKKYTRKQICEAISYWRKQLRAGNYRKMNEGVEGNFNYILIKNGIDTDFMTTYDNELEALDDFYTYLNTIDPNDFDAFYVEYNSGDFPLYRNNKIVPKTKDEVSEAFDKHHFVRYDDYHVPIAMVLCKVNNLDEIKNFLISNGQSNIDDLGDGNIYLENLNLDCDEYEFWDLLKRSNQDPKSKRFLKNY